MAIIREGTEKYGHGYRIESTDPKRDATTLALRLGNALENGERKRLDASNYATLANEWTARAQEERNNLERVLERDRLIAAGQSVDHLIKHITYIDEVTGKETKKPSRMDPLLTYTTTAIQEQVRVAEENAKRFREDSARFTKEAEEFQREFLDAQKTLAEVNAEIRSRR